MTRTGRFVAVLLTAAGVSVAAEAANAGVVFGYDVNSSPGQAAVSFDGSDLSMQDAAGTTVDFTAQRDGSGTVYTFASASVTLDAELTSSTSLTDATLLRFAGELTFSDDSADPIVTFTFDDSSLYLPDGATSAALTWSSSNAAGDVTSGSALEPMLGSDELVLPADFAFTLTNLQGDASAFDAHTSFSATATVIPEPTSLALLGVVSATLLRRRRK